MLQTSPELLNELTDETNLPLTRELVTATFDVYPAADPFALSPEQVRGLAAVWVPSFIRALARLRVVIETPSQLLTAMRVTRNHKLLTA